MKKSVKLRNEWKYVCGDNDLCLAENRISKVLKLDSHIKTGSYRVRSLYFDDINNSCINDNDAGVGKRFKYRIRYYNNNSTYVVLEKKEKINGLGRKIVAQISLEECEAIINGENLLKLFWNTNNKLLKEFCIDSKVRLFKPKIIVDYERTAYVDYTTDVRITFDRNVSGSKDINLFLRGNYARCPLQEPGFHVLEIKFNEILPSYIKQTIQIDYMNQVSFSKYFLARNMIERG